MKSVLKELLAEIKIISDKLERIEKHVEPISFKVDVTTELAEINAKKYLHEGQPRIRLISTKK